MLNITSFFNQLASQYTARYYSLAARFTPLSPTSSATVDSSPESPAISGSEQVQAEPTSPENTSTATKTGEPQDTLELSTPKSAEIQTADPYGQTAPDTQSATYDREFSHLRYSLDLNFDAQALQRSMQQLTTIQTEDGTRVSETLETLSSLNIGLGLNFQVEGLRVSEQAELTNSVGAEKAGHYQRQAAGNQFENLLKQASRTNQKLPSGNRFGYQLAVNSFALRYSADAQFSFSHFSRFNTQVTALGETDSAAVDSLTSSAGDLAEFASNNLMESFLDSVDAYLGDSEANLLEKIDQFFEIAASELGLSSDAIAQAKEQLSATVENFFDKVESSINALKTQVFGITAPSADAAVIDPAQTGADQPVLDQALATDPNLELLNAMINALDTLEVEPVDTSDIFNPDGMTIKEPEDALADAIA